MRPKHESRMRTEWSLVFPTSLRVLMKIRVELVWACVRN